MAKWVFRFVAVMLIYLAGVIAYLMAIDPPPWHASLFIVPLIAALAVAGVCVGVTSRDV